MAVNVECALFVIYTVTFIMEENHKTTANVEPAVEAEPAVLITIEIDEIVEAIKIQAQHKGSSRAALLKYFKGKLELPSVEDLTVPLKKALDAGVKSGILSQDKQSFKVKGVEFPPPKDSTVISEVLQPPEDATSLPVKKGHAVEVAYEGVGNSILFTKMQNEIHV
jgi:hypothetical protein